MLAALAVFGLLATAAPAETAPVPPASSNALARAREAYNAGQWDAAIAAAREALDTPGDADPARLVLGRALLERYAQTADPQDLEAAREALRAIQPTRLTARDKADLLIGYGQWLYAAGQYGAAAELFASALDRAGPGADSRDRLLDWWASALDRHARAAPERRDAVYGAIIARMEEELARNPASTAASYWLPAAARERGELQRAWQSALAGWLRASLAPEGAAALRADLDRLVLTAIIPDRARELAGSTRDQRQAADTMVTEWEQFKTRW